MFAQWHIDFKSYKQYLDRFSQISVGFGKWGGVGGLRKIRYRSTYLLCACQICLIIVIVMDHRSYNFLALPVTISVSHSCCWDLIDIYVLGNWRYLLVASFFHAGVDHLLLLTFLLVLKLMMMFFMMLMLSLLLMLFFSFHSSSVPNFLLGNWVINDLSFRAIIATLNAHLIR